MFYPEFTIDAWLVAGVLVSVFVGVLYATGADYIEKHMITFYPEVGIDAVTEKELPKLRLVWPMKEVTRKAA
jgi:hypothetical protein